MSHENDQNEKDLFESVTDPSDTAEEFLQKLDLTHDRWNSDTLWIFRGQNSACWELEPSLFRSWDVGSRPSDEIDLIENFLRIANLANLPIPANTLSYIDNLRQGGAVSTERHLAYKSENQLDKKYDFTHVVFAIAQHSGIPTRLLDFTYDPLIAAYFAADWTGLLESLEMSPQHRANYFDDVFSRFGNSPEDAISALAEYSQKVRAKWAALPKEMAVWAINVYNLRETTLRVLDQPYGEILNLRSQKGVFLCETENYEVKGETWRSFNDKLSNLIDKGGIYKLTLPCTKRAKLFDLLSRKQISPLFLKPTYEQMAKAVVEGLNTQKNQDQN